MWGGYLGHPGSFIIHLEIEAGEKVVEHEE